MNRAMDNADWKVIYVVIILYVLFKKGKGWVIDLATGHQYAIYPGPLSRDLAQEVCLGDGANLVSIGDAAEMAFVDDIVDSSEPYIIGLYKGSDLSHFYWVDGTIGNPVPSQSYFEDWFIFNPNEIGSCACVVLQYGTWRDNDCNTIAKFICEKAIQELSTVSLKTQTIISNATQNTTPTNEPTKPSTSESSTILQSLPSETSITMSEVSTIPPKKPTTPTSEVITEMEPTKTLAFESTTISEKRTSGTIPQNTSSRLLKPTSALEPTITVKPKHLFEVFEPDDRVSAKAMGYVSIGFVSLLFLVILMLDAPQLLKGLRLMKRNLFGNNLNFKPLNRLF